jgi:hypothetical protein
MKKTICFIIMTLLVSVLFGQYPIQFFIETDAETYEYGQPIEITYFLYNPSSEPVDLELPCSNPFTYSIDEVWFHSGCWTVVLPLTIQPYSSFTASDTHTEAVSIGSHCICGNFLDLNSPYVYINVVQTNTDLFELSANDFSLSNYPNPFNPSTTIQFEIAEAREVALEIYNIKGQKVKTLVNENLQAGKHEIVWNGKDEKNQSVASGIYHYKLRTGKYIAHRKMILMK